ncbi:SIR2 family protein [Haliscomenobacter hydrossis]|uniref:Effector-associated domain-containing protein n=1 Tax=Haliscomenobacter hydrossis (strain ATCC 27775 / DSM 1100 / LMG 10767 / O) TaxID=760192 RepID=F4L7J9_HALH1|nr:SIR2 family protein [Haliscomenobacter hydrossis]AEE54179.1 hypothetical protein Halhy_6360 [Haliscomenobacter hydrossis DSM 1100]
MSAHTLAPSQIAWKDLLKSLGNQQCVLLIGPNLLPGENLFLSLLRHLGIDPEDITDSLPKDIAMVYPAENLFLFPNVAARTRIWRRFEEFYNEHLETLRPLYTQIARLPFPVVINTMPDLGLRRSFEQDGILHQFSYYDYRGTPEPYDRIQGSPRDTRLLFNICGVLSDPDSLVLTHDDLFGYFSHILSQKLSSEHYIDLKHTLKNATDFIFLGFQFDQWRTQMLLRLLNPERNKGIQYAVNPALAAETRVFFADQFEVEFVDSISPAEFLTELCSRWTAEEEQRQTAGAPLKQTLRDWLRQGLLTRILERMDQTPVQADATFQLSRLSTLRKSIRDSVLSSESALLEMNKIRKAVQELIEILP